MKRWFSPPIQTLLWLAGLACLGLAAWGLMQLRLLDERQGKMANVNVQIPDSALLAAPGVDTYTRLVEAPLFWEGRTVPKVEAAPPPVVADAPAPAPPPPPLEPPAGRLIGIVDVGKKKYALIRSEGEEKNLSLYVGDKWEGWTVEAISAEKLVLAAGEQRQEVKLIADFAAPAENQQVAQNRKKQQQKQQMAAARQQQAQAQQAAATVDPAAAPIPVVEPAVDGAPAGNTAPASPAMSIKEALEARQRLMASRWGGAAGAQNQSGQPQSGRPQ